MLTVMVILTPNKWSIITDSLLSRYAQCNTLINCSTCTNCYRSKVNEIACCPALKGTTNFSLFKAGTCDCSCILKRNSAHIADGHTYTEQYWHTHAFFFVELHMNNSGMTAPYDPNKHSVQCTGCISVKQVWGQESIHSELDLVCIH